MTTTARTLLDLLQTSSDWLAERGIANARRETEWLFAHVLSCQRLDLYLRFDMPIDGEATVALRDVVRRRGKREPLAYIIGTQPFCSLELVVSPDVLVPRPETEELVAAVLAAYPDDGSAVRIVDVGTGSGAIALALAQARPSWQMTAVDISEQALAVARGNGQRYPDVSVQWQHSDLLAACSGDWDVIVSNPPYIGLDEQRLCDPELAFEPQQALYAGADGFDVLRRLLPQMAASLASDGTGWIEHGFAQAPLIAELAAASGLQATTHQDGAGHPRWTVIRHKS